MAAVIGIAPFTMLLGPCLGMACSGPRVAPGVCSARVVCLPLCSTTVTVIAHVYATHLGELPQHVTTFPSGTGASEPNLALGQPDLALGQPNVALSHYALSHHPLAALFLLCAFPFFRRRFPSLTVGVSNALL